MKKAIILISCWLMTLGVSYSQSYNTYPELNKFKNWSITGEVGFYTKAELNPVYGTFKPVKTLPTIGYKVGIEYEFFSANKWSYIIGLSFQKAPMVNWTSLLPDMDGLDIEKKEYGGGTIVVPLLLSYKQKIYENIYMDFRIGVDVILLDPVEMFMYGSPYFRLGMGRENAENFSLTASIGCIFDMKYILLKSHISYYTRPSSLGAYNGTYEYIYPGYSAGGYIKQSGNYLGLSLSFNLKKFKYMLDN